MAKAPIAYDNKGNYIYDYVEVKIDEKTLTDIAELTNGKYFRATDNESLKNIYSDIDNMEKSKIEVTEYNEYSEEFYPFAFWALILLALALILQYTFFRKTP